jgi:hypothetical protein
VTLSAAVRPETECGFQDAVIQLAKLRGWKVYHTWNSKHSEAGFPDLLMLRGERIIAAELKRDGKRPTPAQDEWLVAFGRAGVLVYEWHPKDWDDIQRTIR